MSVASGEDVDEIRERILTGYKDGKPFTPYVPTIALPGEPERVLDFGCGLGRNFPYLTRAARAVTGFDLPPMIARCRTAAPVAVDELSDDWAQLRTRRFDLIFASLVLQHVEPDALRVYLEDFARMASSIYLLTRTDTDFGERLLDVVADTALFDAGECVEVDHDPVTHQLRVLGRRPFAEARADRESRHYELILSCRADRAATDEAFRG